MKTILSLFDYTGNWSRPYKENGYNVIQIDKKLGIDILNWDYSQIKDVYGILAAIPCTDYALSGGRWFAEKDKDGRTKYSQKLVAKTKEIIDYFKPTFYAIENPRSRIHKLNIWMGKPRLKFNPYDYAQYDPIPKNSQYRKETWLWGNFNILIKKQLPDLYDYCPMWYMSGKSEKDRGARSITPLGFAYAFYEVNNEKYIPKNVSLFNF